MNNQAGINQSNGNGNGNERQKQLGQLMGACQQSKGLSRIYLISSKLSFLEFIFSNAILFKDQKNSYERIKGLGLYVPHIIYTAYCIYSSDSLQYRTRRHRIIVALLLMRRQLLIVWTVVMMGMSLDQMLHSPVWTYMS